MFPNKSFLSPENCPIDIKYEVIFTIVLNVVSAENKRPSVPFSGKLVFHHVPHRRNRAAIANLQDWCRSSIHDSWSSGKRGIIQVPDVADIAQWSGLQCSRSSVVERRPCRPDCVPSGHTINPRGSENVSFHIKYSNERQKRKSERSQREDFKNVRNQRWSFRAKKNRRVSFLFKSLFRGKTGN